MGYGRLVGPKCWAPRSFCGWEALRAHLYQVLQQISWQVKEPEAKLVYRFWYSFWCKQNRPGPYWVTCGLGLASDLSLSVLSLGLGAPVEDHVFGAPD